MVCPWHIHRTTTRVRRLEGTSGRVAARGLQPWPDLLGVERHRLRFTVMIHETADVAAAEQYWADPVGAARSTFSKTTLKRHNPKTVRKNVGDSYRGRLVIKVLKGAELYRRIEGSWCGIVESANKADQVNRT